MFERIVRVNVSGLFVENRSPGTGVGSTLKAAYNNRVEGRHEGNTTTAVPERQEARFQLVPTQ
jgi:hypothetical protein